MVMVELCVVVVVFCSFFNKVQQQLLLSSMYTDRWDFKVGFFLSYILLHR